jgi:hypothetical protein
MGADRFSPLTLTKCSGRGRVNRPVICTSRAALSLDTQGSAAVPDWVHKNTYHFFQSKQVFDASVLPEGLMLLLNGCRSVEIPRCYSAFRGLFSSW